MIDVAMFDAYDAAGHLALCLDLAHEELHDTLWHLDHDVDRALDLRQATLIDCWEDGVDSLFPDGMPTPLTH